MKRICSVLAISAFLTYCVGEVQGQTTQPQLDQVKLMQKNIGPWQLVINKDTTEIIESQQYGNIFISSFYLLVKDTKSLAYIQVYCYSPEHKKFNVFTATQGGTYITFSASYVAENKFVVDILQNFNPDQLLMKVETIYDTPESMTMSNFNAKGVKIGESTKWTKIKL